MTWTVFPSLQETIKPFLSFPRFFPMQGEAAVSDFLQSETAKIKLMRFTMPVSDCMQFDTSEVKLL
jgi:hypothetical protein